MFLSKITLVTSIMLGFIAMSIPFRVSSQSVIATGNGNQQDVEFSLDWTIGEPITASLFDADVDVTFGFHQPIELCLSCENDDTFQNAQNQSDLSRSAKKSRLSVFPNPMYSDFHLHLENLNIGQVNLEIYNVVGQQLHNQILNIHSKYERFSISVETIPAGQYFLRVSNEDFSKIQKIQIIN